MTMLNDGLYRNQERPSKEIVQKKIIKELREVDSKHYSILLPSTTKQDINLMINGFELDGVLVEPKLNARHRLIFVENGYCPEIINGYSISLSTKNKNSLRALRKLSFICDTKIWSDKQGWRRGFDFKGTRGSYFDSQIYFHLNDLYRLDINRATRVGGQSKVGLLVADLCGAFSDDFIEWFFQNHSKFHKKAQISCTFCITSDLRRENNQGTKGKKIDYEKLPFQKNDVLIEQIGMESYENSIDKHLYYAENCLDKLSTLGFKTRKAFLYSDKKNNGGNVMLSVLMDNPTKNTLNKQLKEPSFTFKNNISKQTVKTFWNILKRDRTDSGFDSLAELDDFVFNSNSFTENKKRNYDSRTEASIQKSKGLLIKHSDLFKGYQHLLNIRRGTIKTPHNKKFTSSLSRDGFLSLKGILYSLGNYYYYNDKYRNLPKEIRPFSEFSEGDRSPRLSNFYDDILRLAEKNVVIDGYKMKTKWFNGVIYLRFDKSEEKQLKRLK